MTNYEFYKDRFIHALVYRAANCEMVREIMGEDCDHSVCPTCEREMEAWLRAEYVEPKIDWRKVEPGTLVTVKNGDGLSVRGLTFIGYYKGRVYAAIKDEFTATGFYAPNVELYKEKV